eukprot:gene14487-biopygen6621
MVCTCGTSPGSPGPQRGAPCNSLAPIPFRWGRGINNYSDPPSAQRQQTADAESGGDAAGAPPAGVYACQRSELGISMAPGSAVNGRCPPEAIGILRSIRRGVPFEQVPGMTEGSNHHCQAGSDTVY